MRKNIVPFVSFRKFKCEILEAPYKKKGVVKTQTGRSMVEMVGVLILVGVLSIGALFGYEWAIDKYRSNMLVQDVLRRAVHIKNQLDSRSRNINLNKFEKVSLMGAYIDLENNLPITENGKTIVGIYVQDVSRRVCQMTFDATIGLMSVKVGEVEYNQNDRASDVCLETKNTMVFYLDDTWEYKRNKTPYEPENSTSLCPEIDQCSSEEDCFYGEVCVDGCCVENTQVYTSEEDTQTSATDEVTTATDMCVYSTDILDAEIVSTSTDIFESTEIVSTQAEITCQEGYRIYCSKEGPYLVGDDANKTRATIQQICANAKQAMIVYYSGSPEAKEYENTKKYVETIVYHSTCVEWKCTNAPVLLQDPTRNVQNDNEPEMSFAEEKQMQKDIQSGLRVSGTPGRDLEVPIKNGNVTPYCALEYNGKCALVTYCDGSVYDVKDRYNNTMKYQQRCSSCKNPLDQKGDTVCVGSQFKKITELTDGVDALIFFTQDKENVCISELNSCPEGKNYSGISDPQCCYGTAWGPCSSCGGWMQYTDNCGLVYGVGDICCGALDRDVGGGCSGLDESSDGCYENYPINNLAQCCNISCKNGEDEFCCDNSTKDRSEGCCQRMGGVWDASATGDTKCLIETASTFPYTDTVTYTETLTPGVSVTFPEETLPTDTVSYCDSGYIPMNGVDMPYDGCIQRNTAMGYNWCCPVSSVSTSPYDTETTSISETTVPYPTTSVSVPITPETTTPLTPSTTTTTITTTPRSSMPSTTSLTPSTTTTTITTTPQSSMPSTTPLTPSTTTTTITTTPRSSMPSTTITPLTPPTTEPYDVMVSNSVIMSETTLPKVCRWTGWINNSNPENSSGDYETLDGLCNGGEIQKIMCRAVMFPNTPLDELEQVVSCDVYSGLICQNNNQRPGGPTRPQCLDYEIDAYCCK